MADAASLTIKYKSPVFAVFPFEQPDVFSYPRPNLQACDPYLLKSIQQLELDQAKGVGKKRARKAPKKKKSKK